MGKYVAKRIIQLIPTLFFVILTAFLLMKLIPGDPAMILLGPQARAEDIARFRQQLGLDRPLPVQFLIYLKRVLMGDLGISLVYRQSVLSLILERLPVTITLSLCALVIAVSIGIPAGVMAAMKHNSFIDLLVTILALMGLSMPIFWFGMMLIIVFSLELGWLPAVGLGDPTKGLWDVVSHFILPSLALGILSTGTIARFTRSSMLEVLNQDYIRTAYAKGLRRTLILYRHALRNALVPVITVIGLQLGNLLAGAVLTETVFALPGLGKLMVDGIFRRDYMLVQGEVLFTAILYIFVNLAVDIAYAFINPKIRQTYRGV
ncbi:glutathione ABC transporter permease [Pseudothermotoga hypogea DSM 11164 = NBRC 106472]|uniref:Glutathione ABC transporter permease n=1 Tax=Pseudothermotoga hypogea DSM 11164 = NBRC 106472 TaxID=1123384 RepID=A0A0X1KRS2_9THEM|nr:MULTISPECIES: ABC transporter permease [Pseudothermotoga]AJC74015.1 glutathione ABC transporter permease [Pseudothermotoga hypogea DSM 11164 = NBRC 106472]MDI6862443.1 ABC transporter permease [Pseudothermotoga sp.]